VLVCPLDFAKFFPTPGFLLIDELKCLGGLSGLERCKQLLCARSLGKKGVEKKQYSLLCSRSKAFFNHLSTHKFLFENFLPVDFVQTLGCKQYGLEREKMRELVLIEPKL